MSRTQGRKIAAAIMFSIAIASLSFVAGLRHYGFVFWILTFAATIAALVAAIRGQDSPSGNGPGHDEDG